MIEINRLFLDTAPLIYFLDDDENYADKMRDIFYELLTSGVKIITSAVTVTEYLTFPCRTGNVEKINVFFEFINDAGIETAPIDNRTAVKAAQNRAEYPAFKTMDALQLASACVNFCDIFLTNDKQLCQFREIRCETVEQFSMWLCQ